MTKAKIHLQAGDINKSAIDEKDMSPRQTARRELLKRGVLVGGALLLGEGLPLPSHVDAAQPLEKSTVPAGTLRFRGVNYDTGTNYDASYVPVTRTVWKRSLVERDMKAIRERLHCNSVCIFGTDMARLVEASEIAHEHGLHVWLQPRLMEASPEDRLAHLAEAAGEAEGLRRYGSVTLNVGVELSLFMSGIIPGSTFWERMEVLGNPAKRDLPTYWKKLDEHLEVASSVARTSFGGPLTYSAGAWERIRWQPFDIIGLSFYMSAENEATYAQELIEFRSLGKAHGVPVVITEFGCCTFEGAGSMGAMGWSIVDYSKAVPEIPENYVRSEQEQADYLVKLLGIYEAEEIGGAFVYNFSSPDSPHASNPKYDLDTASFAIVKLISSGTDAEATEWEPKKAFHEIARTYRRLERP